MERRRKSWQTVSARMIISFSINPKCLKNSNNKLKSNYNWSLYSSSNPSSFFLLLPHIHPEKNWVSPPMICVFLLKVFYNVSILWKRCNVQLQSIKKKLKWYKINIDWNSNIFYLDHGIAHSFCGLHTTIGYIKIIIIILFHFITDEMWITIPMYPS